LCDDLDIAQDMRHDEMTAVIGKSVTSTRDLTKAEAKKIIDAFLTRRDALA
jgi:hypothetical protein